MFQTNPFDLGTLLKDVEAGKIQLPDFQRGWVWEDERIRGLLDSISRRFPIGAVMTLEAGGEINFKTRLVEGVKGNPADAPQQFILDGQQRLTSLYQTLLSLDGVDTKDSRNKKLRLWYYIDMLKAMDEHADREEVIVSVPASPDPSVDRKVRNSSGQVTLDLSTPELEFQNHMMPTEKLLDSYIWISEYNEFWRNNGGHPKGNEAAFMAEFAKSVVAAFDKYPVPVIKLDKTTSKEAVCAVFEKVNRGGVVLTVFELVTAAFAADAGITHFSLRDDWEARKNRLYRLGVLQSVSGDQFLQAVALLTTQERRRDAERQSQNLPAIRCNRDAILSLNLDDYRKWADKVERGFVEAAQFLDSQYVFTADDVPYGTQLVTLAALYAELGQELEPAIAKGRLERWFWCGVLGEAYSSSVENRIAMDFTEVAEYVRRGTEPRTIAEANFDPARLPFLTTRRSAAYKGIYALQMKSGAADWRTAKPLSSATKFDDNIEIHHIFPVGWCNRQNPAIPPRIYNSVINKTPIDGLTNRIIGRTPPSTYLSRLEARDISRETLEQILQAHWLNPSLLRADDFVESFMRRGEAMMGLIGKAMGKELPGGREAFRSALVRAGLAEPMEGTSATAEEEYEDPEEDFESVTALGFDEEREAAD